jgi:hypothetical protein
MRKKDNQDLLFGEGGRDLFEYDVIVFAGEFGGADVVADFTRGQDVLALRFTDFDGITRGTFDDLDSNGNGRLGDRDAFVEVVRVTLGGVTEISTVIDVGGFAASVGLPVSGTNTLTVFGVTGLTAGDLAGESLG